MPELFAAAAVEPDFTAGQGEAEGLLIHIAEHEDFTGIGILNYGGDKPFFVEFEIIYFLFHLPHPFTRVIFSLYTHPPVVERDKDAETLQDL